jgi:dihydrofolate reductase
MPKIRYSVAMSLDGYIAGPNGECDWIVAEPEVNFAEIWAQFDTFLMGRRTYEPMVARFGKKAGVEGKKAYVFSRTLQQRDHPYVTILPEVTREHIQTIRTQSQKDIWLFGGGELFRSLLELGEVDTVEVSIVPVLLGGGLPLVPTTAQQTRLKLISHRIYPFGLASLTYEVQR